MRKIPVHFLKPGMELAKEILNDKGLKLLSKGIILEGNYIKNLKKLGIPSVYIVDSLIPDVEIEDVIADKTRQEAQNLVRNILSNAEKQSIKTNPSLLFMKKQVTTILDNIIEQLMSNSNLIINLTDIRTADNYTFSHCVNVAVLSITIALAFGYPRADLIRIGLGALLHDLGKVNVPAGILNKPGKLTNEEFKEIKKHPQSGYDMAIKRELSYVSSALIVLQHHERINGKGYPNGLKGNEMHKYSKIAAVADVYDALVADRPYRVALQPHKALEIIETSGDEFDLSVLQEFMKYIAAYPIGTIVGLSNGLVGIVVHNTVGFPTRPRVRVFCDKEFYPVDNHEIDLMEIYNVVVEKAFTEKETPRQLVEISTQGISQSLSPIGRQT